MSDIHRIEFQVRDYELDMQGVVNNSVYGNYFEHARHEFLISKGVDFALLTDRGVHLVVVKIEIEYKRSLKSRDQFNIETRMSQKSRLKFQFDQCLTDRKTHEIIANATVTGVAVNAETHAPMRLEKLSALINNTHAEGLGIFD